MTSLIWFRALMKWNFFNWNKKASSKSFELVLRHLNIHEEFNVGQRFEVVSVNRTTGKIEMRHAID